MSNPTPDGSSSNKDKLAGLANPMPAQSPPPPSGVPPWERANPTSPSRSAPSSELGAGVNDTLFTSRELDDHQLDLLTERDRLLEEIAEIQQSLVPLQGRSTPARANAGAHGFEREAELSLLTNARDMLEQVEYALARINEGTYEVCETCGGSIGKYRLQAFPRATLCLSCKQAEEALEGDSAEPISDLAQVMPRFEASTPSMEWGAASGSFATATMQPKNGKGTAALVCGILGLIPFPITGFWLSLIGIILGWQGRKRAERGEATNRGVATAGFVLGIVGMGIQALLGLAIAFS